MRSANVHIIIIINAQGWSKNRYDDIVTRLSPFLKQNGFKMKKQVSWIPISALKGHNVKDRLPAGLAPWAAKCCGGMSLLEKLDATKVGGRDPNAARGL